MQYPNLDTISTIQIDGEAKLFGFNINQPITGIEEENIIPAKFNLYDPYPNPFNNQTKIKIDLPSYSDVELVVYDLLGKEVAIIYKGMLQQGSHEFEFNSLEITSGIYILQLRTDNLYAHKKLVLIK